VCARLRNLINQANRGATPRAACSKEGGYIMSVPVSERGENKLEVLTKCEELVQHTLHITSNENVFDPRYAYLSAMVCDHVIQVYRMMWQANNIVVKVKADYLRRKQYQDIAADELTGLMAEIDLCKGVFHLRNKKSANWVKMASTVRGLLKRWAGKDAKRYEGVA
jgi:hypothetical protein